jgi:hypothetical protein
MAKTITALLALAGAVLTGCSRGPEATMRGKYVNDNKKATLEVTSDMMVVTVNENSLVIRDNFLFGGTWTRQWPTPLTLQSKKPEAWLATTTRNVSAASAFLASAVEASTVCDNLRHGL